MPRTAPDKERAHLSSVLEEVEARLEEAERDHVGNKRRGLEKIRALLRAEAPSGVKRSNVNQQAAQAELNSLIYQRHSLRHGFFRLTDMNHRQRAESFLGPEGSKMQITDAQARLILKEQWRWGRSPVLEDFRKKLAVQLERRHSTKANYCRKRAVRVMEQWRGKQQRRKQLEQEKQKHQQREEKEGDRAA